MLRSIRAKVIVSLGFALAAFASIAMGMWSVFAGNLIQTATWSAAAVAATFSFRITLQRTLYPERTDHWRSSLLDSLLPLELQKDVYANLDELMPQWTEAHGEQIAKRIRRRQAWRIVIGHYMSALLDACSKVIGIVKGS